MPTYGLSYTLAVPVSIKYSLMSSLHACNPATCIFDPQKAIAALTSGMSAACRTRRADTAACPVLAEAEALGSIGYNSRVEVDDGSTGGNRLEAVSRPRTAGCSETPDRGGQS